MVGRTLALAALVVLLAVVPAWAAPVTVQLRVEGSAGTIFEGPVTTDGKTIDKGTGPHPCDGTAGGVHATPVPTMTSALDDGSIAAGFPWTGTWFDFGDYALNLVTTQLGGCSEEVASGDEVLFAYDYFDKAHILNLIGPRIIDGGQTATVSVINGPAGPPIADATISGGPIPATTGPDGRATVSFDSPGVKRLKADRPDSVRSATLIVCVKGPGEACENLPAVAGAVHDSRAPRVRIAGLRDGQRLRRGPRLLRGTATDDVGVTQVKLALRRHHRGKPCQWWSGRREKFVGTSCDKRFFFSVGTNASWSYQLPQALPAGRYVLDVKAFDRARNRDERFVRGQNRVVFYVAGKRRAGAASRRARGVPVQVMVTGRSATLAVPRIVRTRPVTLRAGKRRCLVAGATPLAALAAALPQPRFRLRDYGSCSRRSPAGSGQLFVNRIGPDRNAGGDGWFYKVGGRAGTAGAGDSGGPFGDGKLRRGAQVLWFFCVFQPSAGSCQRTLAIEANRSVEQGAGLPVRVVGYDNEGRARPVEGARVMLGETVAVTGSDGRCTVATPAAGRLALRAELAGMVDAFPLRVRVT
jgi:hypothetical protein